MKAAALLLVLAACAPQPRIATVHAGYLECSPAGHATAWVNVDVLRSAAAPGVIAHEEHHLRLARSFPSCREFVLWQSVPGHRLAMEAAAYCAQAAADAQRFGGLEAALDYYAEALASPIYRWPRRLSVADARRLLARTCEGVPPP